MIVGSVFAGIGGFDLGLERAGMQIQWQVEIDEWCRRVLTKHWPDVPKYGDIRALDWSTVAPVDLLCGGFPCQPFSVAGKRQGADDDRNMWPEFRRAVAALKPRWVLGENVSGAKPYLETVVLPDLEALGYETAVLGIPACAVGAPHQRERLWIVAHTTGTGTRSDNGGLWERVEGVSRGQRTADKNAADTSQSQRDGRGDWTCGWEREPQEALRDARGSGREEAWMSITESLLGRVAHGIPHRVDRLRGLGNAVVPQIVEFIGRQLLAVESLTKKEPS